MNDGSGGPEQASITQRRTQRRRVEKACDICRRRKERCNGAKPQCSTCKVAKRACLYTSETKRRGLPEGWVKALERLYAFAMQCIPDLEATILRLMRDESSHCWHADFLKTWTNTVESHDLAKEWKQSTLCDELQRLLYELDATDIAPEDQSGAARLQGLYDLVERQYENQQRIVSVRDQATVSAPLVTSRPRPPPDANKLIDFHFLWTQNWLPIMDRGHVHRSLYHVLRDEAGESRANEASLYALLSLSLVRRRHAIRLQSGTPSPLHYADHAQQILNDSIGPPTTATVQTLLLLALYEIARSRHEGAWLLVGRASRSIALIQRAHHDEATSQSTVSPPEILTRLNLAAFVRDSLISAHLGLLSTFNSVGNGCALNERLVEDGAEEWAPGPSSSADPSATDASEFDPGFCLSAFNRLVDRCVELRSIMAGGTGDRVSSVTTRAPIRASNFPQHQTLRLLDTLLRLLELPNNDKRQNCNFEELLINLQTRLTTYSVHYPLATVPIIWLLLISLVTDSLARMTRSNAVESTSIAIAQFLKAAQGGLVDAAPSRISNDEISNRHPTSASAVSMSVGQLPITIETTGRTLDQGDEPEVIPIDHMSELFTPHTPRASEHAPSMSWPSDTINLDSDPLPSGLDNDTNVLDYLLNEDTCGWRVQYSHLC